jgi:ribA/ribD-fused uncharacterized protein
MKEINSFRGEFKFLSNFYLRPIRFDGLVYPAVENAYQAQKTTYVELRYPFLGYRPAVAKKKGRDLVLRKGWDKMRNGVMLALLRIKFSERDLAVKLMATYPDKLVEGNWWRDEYWGVYDGRGKNVLGKLLMKVRDERMKADGVCAR